MRIKILKKVNKLYKNSWFITLFATTLGVLLAFYLNNLSSRYRIEERKEISINNIQTELRNNKIELTDSANNKRLIEFLTKVEEIDDEIPNELITSIKSMSKIKKNFSDFIIIKDSIGTDQDKYKYQLAYKFDLVLEDLQNIAWEAFKMSDITNELDYSCLQILVKIYSLQDIYIKEQQKILDYFVKAEHSELLGSLKIVQQLKSQLLNNTEQGLSKIKSCN